MSNKATSYNFFVYFYNKASLFSQAVQFQDSAVVVDLLSVIILRPSIWNLDLCLLLLPAMGELLHSKYESYVNAATGALKLVLKNFGTVIKSNIDTPGWSLFNL